MRDQAREELAALKTHDMEKARVTWPSPRHTELKEPSMSQDEAIDFHDALALCTEDQYSLWSVASYWPWRCQGITKAGVLCQAICRKIKLEEYWPGVTDRCIHHIDEMARRTVTSPGPHGNGAADVEALPPYERHHRLKRIRRADKRGWPP